MSRKSRAGRDRVRIRRIDLDAPEAGWDLPLNLPNYAPLLVFSTHLENDSLAANGVDPGCASDHHAGECVSGTAKSQTSAKLAVLYSDDLQNST